MLREQGLNFFLSKPLVIISNLTLLARLAFLTSVKHAIMARVAAILTGTTDSFPVL